MKLSLTIATAGLLCLAFGSGCVSQKKYKELQGKYTQLTLAENEARIKAQQCTSDLATSNARLASLQDQIASERGNLAALQAALDKCLTSSSQGSVNISKLVDEINSSNKYIQQLIAAKGKSDSLNMLMTNNLTRSLSRDEAKDVNVEVLKGVVYISLADNMLYKSGSYEVSDQASTVLSKIAKIIKDYGDYDVLIEGNTDNVPIAKSNIRNNWDLSALRASSVVQVLQDKYQIDPKRMTAGGRGEYNPLAPNDTEQGKARNRRTQIIVTPKLDQFMDLIDKAPEGENKN